MDKLPVCLRTHLRTVCFSEEMSAVWEWWGEKPALLNFFILKSIYCAVRKDFLCVFCTPAIQRRSGIIQRPYGNFVYIWSTWLVSINPGFLVTDMLSVRLRPHRGQQGSPCLRFECSCHICTSHIITKSCVLGLKVFYYWVISGHLLEAEFSPRVLCCSCRRKNTTFI